MTTKLPFEELSYDDLKQDLHNKAVNTFLLGPQQRRLSRFWTIVVRRKEKVLQLRRPELRQGIERLCEIKVLALRERLIGDVMEMICPSPTHEELKQTIYSKLMKKLDMKKMELATTNASIETVRHELRLVVGRVCDCEQPDMDRKDRKRLIDEVLNLVLQPKS